MYMSVKYIIGGTNYLYRDVNCVNRSLSCCKLPVIKRCELFIIRGMNCV